MKRFTQASVQIESSLTGRKRAICGQVTDAREWYFMECTLDEVEKPSFKLSEPASAVYKSDSMQVMVEEVLVAEGGAEASWRFTKWKE